MQHPTALHRPAFLRLQRLLGPHIVSVDLGLIASRFGPDLRNVSDDDLWDVVTFEDDLPGEMLAEVFEGAADA